MNADEATALAVDRRLGPVRRIGVFRALVLGDVLCATPALRRLRRRFPQARITLIGLPWAREWVRRQSCVDDFVAFPGYPGLPERALDEAAWPGFLAEVQARRFDLLVQLHGSGGIVNALLGTWGARHLLALHPPGLPGPGLTLGLAWPSRGTEVERLLRLVSTLGLAPGAPTRPTGNALEFPLRPEDRDAARALLARWGLAGRAYACVHAGAQLPSRRWPLERYAQVVQAMAARGLAVVLTGVAAEADLTARLGAMAGVPCVDLAGQTTLWSLGALIEGASLLVCNDTGVSHVAAALGTPSVVISSGADVARWAPRDTRLHPVLWSDQPCRPCSHAVCPHGHACALGVSTEAVIARIGQQLQHTG